MKKFEITSGTIVASDPCYEIPTWCQGIIEKVKKGIWVAHVQKSDEGDWGTRNAELTITHENHQSVYFTGMDVLNFSGGVDSGQFGFFDKDFYRKDKVVGDLIKQDFGENYDREDGDVWYRACCAVTLGNEDGKKDGDWGNVGNFGVVASSGYGDGSYPVFGVKDGNNEYVGFKVVFIGEEEEDEDEETCEDCGESFHYCSCEEDGDVCGVCNEEKDECICDDDEE